MTVKNLAFCNLEFGKKRSTKKSPNLVTLQQGRTVEMIFLIGGHCESL
jgi:hypothetical protein